MRVKSVIKHFLCLNLNMKIDNTLAGFVRLWRELERTRLLFQAQYKCFCLRRILQHWYGKKATDDFIWEVSYLASDDIEEPILGYDVLPEPAQFTRKHREILQALVHVELNITKQEVNLEALDKAYSIAFPYSTPININKKILKDD